MALVIEDGTGVAGANSFATVEQFRRYVKSLGYEPPETYEESEIYLNQAMNWFITIEHKLQGTRAFSFQETPWPRNDVWLNRMLLKRNMIPYQVRYAQQWKAMEFMVGKREMDNIANERGAVTKEKIGDMEINYQVINNPNKSRAHTPAMSDAETLMRPFMKFNGYEIIRT